MKGCRNCGAPNRWEYPTDKMIERLKYTTTCMLYWFICEYCSRVNVLENGTKKLAEPGSNFDKLVRWHR